MREEELLKLTNHDKRKAVLEAWKDWPIWWEIPEIGLTVRRLDLPRGGAFTASWYEGDDRFLGAEKRNVNRPRFEMLGTHGKLASGNRGESILIEELQRQRKEILEGEEK